MSHPQTQLLNHPNPSLPRRLNQRRPHNLTAHPIVHTVQTGHQRLFESHPLTHGPAIHKAFGRTEHGVDVPVFAGAVELEVQGLERSCCGHREECRAVAQMARVAA